MSVAISPARSAMSFRSSRLKPSFDTVTLYVPVTESAGSVAVPALSDNTSRTAPVAALTAATLAPLTAAPVGSTTSTISVAVFGDCAASGSAASSTKRNRFKEGPPL